jgi:hypothetical protein
MSSCSFCGKSEGEVARLIAGPSVFICNECVDLCAAILAESPPEPPGPLHVLVQLPDGTVHGCQRESDWMPLSLGPQGYEWCAARGRIRGSTPLHVVAVRKVGEGPAQGMAVSVETKLTEDHARAVVERM